MRKLTPEVCDKVARTVVAKWESIPSTVADFVITHCHDLSVIETARIIVILETDLRNICGGMEAYNTAVEYLHSTEI